MGGAGPLWRLLVWGSVQTPTSHGSGEFHPQDFFAVDETTDVSSSPEQAPRMAVWVCMGVCVCVKLPVKLSLVSCLRRPTLSKLGTP